ncbi:MAG: cytochrome P450 [Myxococcota bacterium]
MSAEPLVFDPSDPTYIADPYPTYRRLRNEAPVYWWDQGHMWLLSRYADIEATFKDPRFSVDVREWRLYDAERRGVLPPEMIEFYENGLFQVGHKGHARLRKLVAPAFTPRGAARREQLVQQVVDELLADVDPQERFDLLPGLAEHVPIRVISRTLGVPAELEEPFREWSEVLVKTTFPILPPDEYAAVAARFPSGYRLVEQMVEERRAAPGDDLLSELIAVQEQGDRLSSIELVSLVGGLITAGAETTVHLQAFAVLELLRHPDVLARILDDFERLPGAIEEVLRHDNFSAIGVPRYALEPVELRGQAIAQGDMVMLLVGSSMHDEEIWPDAERFDIDRDPVVNLSFGRGAHFCLGAHLARLEARVVLRTLLERFPRMSLAGEPTFDPHPFIRRIKSLPLWLQPRADS